MKRRRGILLAGVLLALVAGSPLLVHLSYSRACARADAIVAPMQGLVRIDGRFAMQHCTTGEWAFCWEFTYDAVDVLVVGPVKIQVSALGEVLATNPSDLVENFEAASAARK